MTPPPVTVLMSVYNGAAHVRESIDSILRQSHAELELLVIDDASTDATPAILTSYRDARLRVLRNAENLGLTRSLNLGLRAARAPLVARQDADDVAHRHRLARQLEFLRSHPEVAVAGSRFVSIDERGRRRPLHLWMKCATPLGIRWQLMFENPFIHSAVVFRRGVVLDEFGGYDEGFRTNQDFELWSRIARVHPLRNLREPLVALRGRRTSVGAGYAPEALAKVAAVFRGNVAATIGDDPAAPEGIDLLLRMIAPRLYGPLPSLEPLERWLEHAHHRFVECFPEAAALREIRVHMASLIARFALMAAGDSAARMGRWYLRTAHYDVATFARGALRFAVAGARALAARPGGGGQ